jgi:hypothetical protein
MEPTDTVDIKVIVSSWHHFILLDCVTYLVRNTINGCDLLLAWEHVI